MAPDKRKSGLRTSADLDRLIGGGPLSRLFTARWTLLISAIGLIWIAVQDEGEMWRAGVVFIGIILATMFFPRRRKVTRLKARVEARRRAIVPDVHMRKLAAALPDPCFILDRRGIVRFANKPGSTIFGNLKEGDPLSFRIRQPDMLAALDNVLDGGPIEKVDYTLKSHSERFYETWVTPIHMNTDSKAGERPEFILMLLHDQTEQKNIARMRADFVANASHELRTPLASVIGFIETLQGPAKDDSVARDRFLSIMLDQSERMSRLVSDLLSLSRIEMRAHVLPDTKVDLSKIMCHVVDSLSPLAEDLDVTINKKDLEDDLWVAGDRDELVQVFENLVENAIKYGKSGKKIDISYSNIADPADDTAYHVLSVKDYGPGISQEHLPRLTERFYRVDVASSREQKGTGLGLAIVKHILTRHRGRLLVESQPGEGATFQVRLPVSKSDSL
nr:ATP-binding protein [uncultured Cohaesibacter sp.]